MAQVKSGAVHVQVFILIDREDRRVVELIEGRRGLVRANLGARFQHRVLVFNIRWDLSIP